MVNVCSPIGIDVDNAIWSARAFSTSAALPMNRRKLSTSLFKALDILTLLGSHRKGLRINEIVDSMLQPRSSLLRYLDSLSYYGLIERDAQRRYVVTAKFRDWRLEDVSEQEVVRLTPLMKRLAKEVGETVLLGRLEGNRVSYLHFEEPICRVRVSPPMDKQYPLEVMAMGKLVMSQRADLVPEDCSDELRAEIDEASVSHVARNLRESEPGIITWGTWLGRPSALSSLLVVAWPDFRFSEESLELVKSILREESAKVGPFALFD